MKVNATALLISFFGVVFVFASDIYPYNFVLFLFFQIIALAYLLSKEKERRIEEMEARIRELEAEKEKQEERNRKTA
jgi:uncharacterized membrane protein